MKTFDYSKLIIERIFFEAAYPILYTCLDTDGARYLAVCCQYNALGKKTLITATSVENVLNLLENRVTIRDAFLTGTGSRYTIFESGDSTNIEEDGPSWSEDSRDLPDKGVYLDAEPGEYQKEIEFYHAVTSFQSYGNNAGCAEVFTVDIESEEMRPCADTVKCRLSMFATVSLTPYLYGAVDLTICSNSKRVFHLSEKMKDEQYQSYGVPSHYAA